MALQLVRGLAPADAARVLRRATAGGGDGRALRRAAAAGPGRWEKRWGFPWMGGSPKCLDGGFRGKFRLYMDDLRGVAPFSGIFRIAGEYGANDWWANVEKTRGQLNGKHQ